MNAWTTIGQYLLRRLNEAGVRHAFGVPGDFNLNLMQQIEDGSEIDWIGNGNELNAAYAADGYARLNGMAALCAQRYQRGGGRIQRTRSAEHLRPRRRRLRQDPPRHQRPPVGTAPRCTGCADERVLRRPAQVRRWTP